MVKKILFCFIAFFLLIQVVSLASATETEIKIKTIRFHEVQATLYADLSAGSTVLERFKGNTDVFGDITFRHISSEFSFNMIVYVKDGNGDTIISKKYTEDFPAGESIYIELAPTGVELTPSPSSEEIAINETNVSLENQTIIAANFTINDTEEEIEITEEPTIETTKITKFAIFGDQGFLSLRRIFYTIGIIILFSLITILTLGVIKHKKLKGGAKEIKIKKLSELQAEKKEKLQESYDDIIDNAEEKIKEALEAIEKLRKSDKIAEVKKKIIEDEKELVRLRGKD